MHEILLADPAATADLASLVAPHLKAGDVVGLTGGLGAGKSHFARALIAARLADCGKSEEIPSPTYTLVQTYDLEGTDLWHVDLYRLGDIDEVIELGLEEAFAAAITLVEWFDRLGPRAPARVLRIALDFVDGQESGRYIRINPQGGGWDWIGKLLQEMRART
jgi:tRNA threonylcarbamoyladenosine biosynthesis protein TsaE